MSNLETQIKRLTFNLAKINLKAEEVDIESKFMPTINAMMAAKKHAKDNNTDVGEIDCPKCGLKIMYTISAYNGHVAISCETDGCIQARE